MLTTFINFIVIISCRAIVKELKDQLILSPLTSPDSNKEVADFLFRIPRTEIESKTGTSALKYKLDLHVHKNQVKVKPKVHFKPPS
jgi:hypothetical protein